MIKIAGIVFVILGFSWDTFESIMRSIDALVRKKTSSRTIIPMFFYIVGSLLLAFGGFSWSLSLGILIALILFSIIFQLFMPYVFLMIYNLIKGYSIFDTTSFRKTNEKN